MRHLLTITDYETGGIASAAIGRIRSRVPDRRMARSARHMANRNWSVRPTYAPGRCVRARYVRVWTWGALHWTDARCTVSSLAGVRRCDEVGGVCS